MKALRDKDIGDAAVNTLEEAAGTGNTIKLELAAELAATLDYSCLARAVNSLEGDGLECLIVYDRIMSLLAFGENLGERGTMPNLDAVLRSAHKIKRGTKISKAFAGHDGLHEGVVTGSATVASTLYPGTTAKAYRVKYSDTEEDLELCELQPLIQVEAEPMRARIVTGQSRAGSEFNQNTLI